MFTPDLLTRAERVLASCRAQGLSLATAESCTGGLISGALTAIPGSSDVFDRAFITYSNTAKSGMLGVPPSMIARHGAVSAEVAAEMALGVLRACPADLAVSVTGVAGPDGGTRDKPVGLVFLAAARRDGDSLVRKCLFGDLGREGVRLAAVAEALAMLEELVR